MRPHSRDAARTRFSPGSKSIVFPSAFSTATPPGAATMSSARPMPATLTASGIGRSMSITSCPASRAAVTRSTRSGVRSSSRPRIFVAAIIPALHSSGGGSSPLVGRRREAPEGLRRRGCAGGAAREGLRGRGCAGGAAREGLRGRGCAGGADSFPFLDVLPRGAQQGALEVVADQRAAGLEQVVEGLQQPPLRGLGLAALGLDALANVAVEEINCLSRGPVDRRGVILAKVHERAKRHSGGDELHAGRDRLEVVDRVEGLVSALDWNEQAGLLQAHQQRFGDAAALGELTEGQGLWDRWTGDRGHERFVGGFELTGEEALDHGQGEALLLELLDPLEPLDMGLAVPGHAALAAGRLEQALALVKADRIHGHPGGPGQLFDPILHEYLL